MAALDNTGKLLVAMREYGGFYTDAGINITPYRDKDICCLHNGVFLDSNDRIIKSGIPTAMEGNGYIRFMPFLFSNYLYAGGALITGWRMSGDYLR